ncbi:MAG: zinc-dependent alcohol dehydrogenase family protein [Gammaproteobacteria bacterium]|nr:zinc-dependent alcohol dehydrogenase family protein [Gammaproteobacteria bacterium]
MKAMVLNRLGEALRLEHRDNPQPGAGQVLLRIKACAVCRTDLHLVDGELPDIHTPIVPGHEVIGEVVACGDGVDMSSGTRLGVPWLGGSCGTCTYCKNGQENLCDDAKFTGYHLDGGYADHMVADHRYCFPIADRYSDTEAAPLMCAGLIGYRSLVMTGDAKSLGIYGFGAAAHIVAQVARYQGRHVYAFTRPGDTRSQTFARELGAVWAGDTHEGAPQKLDAAIIFAPAGELVPQALRAVRKGGIVVCGGIHMSDIPQFPYEILWGEKQLRSVANLTRRDAEEFLALAPEVPIKTRVQTFAVEQANQALGLLRTGQIDGAAVLVP